MNERIQQLKHQASLWCDMNIPDQFGEYGYGEAWEDKFAELIVRECADICYNREYTDGSRYGDEIIEHFGAK